MSEAESGTGRAARLVTELKVSGHLMTLDAGLYCIVQNPSQAADAASGLPGVRLSLPPGPLGRPDAIDIKTFRDDGWLRGAGDAALVRVTDGPAQLLVTVYQAQNADAAGAPRLQVVRLLETASRPQAAEAPAPAPTAAPAVVDVLAHVQAVGDVGGQLGAWIGEPGSKQWIEGFAIAPASGIAAQDIEYQAVLGRGWLSPWVEGGQFCGSRGMALPILGLRLRLRGAAAETHECFYTATFVDGTRVGPVAAGEACEAESLAPVEAFQIVIRPRTKVRAARPAAPPAPVAEAGAESGSRARGRVATPAKPRPIAKPVLKPGAGRRTR
ncbi:conserved protein of unknown function [Rhodovastum atsumiense]|uniref:Hydrophobic W protein n=1 Tax=Rhodovastum atsumiense TaxID=504468 RepID=A0A5M6IJG7_9PROT|nr:hypothetical protein [Rhodovastum atsumiense]KAA5608404.1 hypothetical protein F1189_29170 [Rhodovastum atsumiense]CAH2599408.1 conserved protein of unknown function [Rhodovastum atsumiense]